MRRVVLVELLSGCATDEAARLCGELLRRGPDGAPFDIALLALAMAIEEDVLPYELHGRIYADARELGDDLLAQLLLSETAPVAEGEPKAVVIPGRPHITLGERKALARGPVERHLLDRLLRDPDPMVIEILLANPRLTEPDVVRMAARRPTTPDAQRLIFRSERFIVRYEVKLALASNPYTPSALASRLVPLLSETDRRSLAEDGKLAEAVRAMARASFRIC